MDDDDHLRGPVCQWVSSGRSQNGLASGAGQTQQHSQYKPVLIYCNTGSLSAQVGFALCVVGWDNVKILQGGLQEWAAKGCFDASAKTTDVTKR